LFVKHEVVVAICFFNSQKVLGKSDRVLQKWTCIALSHARVHFEQFSLKTAETRTKNIDMAYIKQQQRRRH
jgi:hypothetical protein